MTNGQWLPSVLFLGMWKQPPSREALENIEIYLDGVRLEGEDLRYADRDAGVVIMYDTEGAERPFSAGLRRKVENGKILIKILTGNVEFRERQA